MGRSLKISIALVLALTLAVLPGCSLFGGEAETSAPETTAADPEPQVKDGIQTLLFVYLETVDTSGSGYYRTDNQAYLVILMVLDAESGTTTMLQLNPDTMVSFTPPGSADTLEVPLGQVYSYGSGGSDSCLNASKAVSALLGGISVNHYMVFSSEAVTTVNDMLGGVTVTVTEDFPAEYPELVKGETVTLLGENAAAYCGYRSEDDVANASRMARQQQYMSAVYDPFVASLQQEDFLTDLTLQLGDGMSTDLTLSQMAQLLETMEDYELSEDILTISGTASLVDGTYQFVLDEASRDQVVEDLFYA